MTDAHTLSLNECLDAWRKYQDDTRPETRNDFLRAYKHYFDSLEQICKTDCKIVEPVAELASREIRYNKEAQDAAQKAIIDFFSIYPGWIFAKEGEISCSYYKGHEASHLAWNVFYAVYPYLRTPEHVMI